MWESTGQEAFRVVMAQNNADQMYITGGRAWDLGYGTQVCILIQIFCKPGAFVIKRQRIYQAEPIARWLLLQVWKGLRDPASQTWAFDLVFHQSDAGNGYRPWPADKLEWSAVGLDVGYWDGGYYWFAVNQRNFSVAGGSGNFFLHVTKDGGGHWESPFTSYADCGEREKGMRWASTGLEVTGIHKLKFHPSNPSLAYASVSDIGGLASDDGGQTWRICKSDLWLNTIYDYAFDPARPQRVYAVGGNFHDWPYRWYANVITGDCQNSFVSYSCFSC